MAKKVQFFQGEQINVTINGNDIYNLDTITFGCVIYPVEDLTKKLRVKKSEMTKTNTNQYIASFRPIDTKNLPVGIYNIEMYDDTDKMIYQQQNSFNISVSASTEYITTNP